MVLIQCAECVGLGNAPTCPRCGCFTLAKKLAIKIETGKLTRMNAIREYARQENLGLPEAKKSIGELLPANTSAPQSNVVSSDEDKKPGVISYALATLLIVIIFYIIRDGGEAEDLVGNKHSAWASAQTYVERQLKSPSSAEFPFGGYRGVTDLGDGLYQVTSYVDAQNAFGAQIRTHFSLKLEKTESGYRASEFSWL